jgi:predicted Zn-dependent protease
MMSARFPQLARLLGATAFAVFLAGCVTDQTSSLVAPANPLPAGAPRLSGDDRAGEREHARLVAAFGGEYRAPEALRLLTEITARLVAATERPDEAYQIAILDSPAVNAFAPPSGRLYVTRGLLALANDASEVAGVLAHEIAHVTLRHASARSELALKSALVSRVVTDVLNDPSAAAMLADQSRFKIAGFSRAQELEADQIGVKTLSKAGYDPYAASRFLSSLGRAGTLAVSAAGAGGRTAADVLSSHPGTPERIALSLQAARRSGGPGLGESGRERYLAAVDGIAYGDNPTDGMVRGRRFVHPRLGIAFEAPEGIALENSAKAVLGASPDGSRRFLFDAIEAAENQSLAEVLRSSWNEAVETESVETLSVNGAPAALAIAKGKEWIFRLAALRLGGTTYRLVLAWKSGPADLYRAFRASLESVRALSAEEARGVRPLRVQLVTAGPGDRVEDIAARMVTANRPLERFLVLNGLERDAALKPGGRYKIVAE